MTEKRRRVPPRTGRRRTWANPFGEMPAYELRRPGSAPRGVHRDPLGGLGSKGFRGFPFSHDMNRSLSSSWARSRRRDSAARASSNRLRSSRVREYSSLRDDIATAPRSRPRSLAERAGDPGAATEASMGRSRSHCPPERSTGGSPCGDRPRASGGDEVADLRSVSR